MIEHVFVINLKSRSDRWNSIQNNFKNTNLKLTRWNAVYGKNLTEKQINKVTSPFGNIFCSRGMIGCWLSHYSLWKHIVKNKLNNVLILEDDAEPVADFNNKINQILSEIPPDYDFVYFGCSGSCDKIGNDTISLLFGKKNKDITDNIMIPAFPFDMHAYLLSYKGALQLIHHNDLKKVVCPIDQALSMYVHNNNKFATYAFKKPLIVQEHNIISSDLLTNDHPIMNYLFSKIKLSEHNNFDFAISSQILHIRRLNVNITGYIILFAVISFLIGLLCSKKVTEQFIVLITCLIVIELLLQKKTNINTSIAEILIIIIFLYSGSTLKNKIKS